MISIFNRKFAVVAGKSGVGRTFVSILLGFCAARQGKKTLLCVLDMDSHYNDLLNISHPPENKCLRIAENLYITTLDPVTSREEYGHMVLKNKYLHKAFFSNKHISSFLDTLPGLGQWAILGKASWYALDNSPPHEKFDLVIFDAPATGRGMDILKLPGAILGCISKGKMREEAQSRLKLLKDSNKTGVLIVSLPEEIPSQEALELVNEYSAEKIPVYSIILNKTLENLPFCSSINESNLEKTEYDFEAGSSLPVQIHKMRYFLQQKCIELLSENTQIPMALLPEIKTELKQSMPFLMDILEKSLNFKKE